MQRHSRTPTLYDKGRRVGNDGAANGGTGRLRHSRLLWRLALLLVSVLFLCGVAAGIALVFQLRLEPAGSGGGGGGAQDSQVVAYQLDVDNSDVHGRRGSEAAAAGSEGRRRRDNVSGREYLASNLSLLLNGGWPSGARFHPTSFPARTDVLNKTVHCDRPLDSDTGLVYSEPTWLCKNVRVVDQNKSEGERPPQRLPFSDTTSRTLEEMMLNRQKELLGNSWSNSGDACGLLPDRRDNVLLLCEMLLAGVTRVGDAAGPVPPASSVHIPYGNCSLPDEKRILLVGMETDDAVWYTEKNLKPGFVTDLYCSFAG